MKALYFIIILLFQTIEQEVNQESPIITLETSFTQFARLKNQIICVNSSYIFFYNDNGNIDRSPIFKNLEATYIVKTNDESLTIFGINIKDTELSYMKYTQNETSYFSNQIIISKSFPFSSGTKFNFRYVEEDKYIFSFFNNTNYYIYMIDLNLNSTPVSPIYNLSNTQSQYNNLQCESFDSKNILCVYSSLSKKSNENSYKVNTYYFFGSDNNFPITELKVSENQLGGFSLIKYLYNGEKRFVICGIEDCGSDENLGVYCQNFIQKDNSINFDSFIKLMDLKKVVFNQNFYLDNNLINPIIITRYDSTIYISINVKGSGSLEEISERIIISSLDFKMNLLVLKNILSLRNHLNVLNDENLLFLITNNRESVSNRIIQIYKFTYEDECINENLIYLNNLNPAKKISLQQLSNKIGKSVSFLLNGNTILNINGIRNLGGLINDIKLSQIQSLEFSSSGFPNIMDNYYIFYSKVESTITFYNTTSNFCYLKIIYCYESCSECSPNSVGSNESHYCSNCTIDYHPLITGEKYFNCYKKGEINLKGHYFDETDEKYYPCDKSCEECSDGNSCDICKEGHFFKKDKLINQNTSTDICYSETPEYYYLNSSANVKYKNKIINFIFQKCYDSCETCYGEGNEKENKCINCKNDSIPSPINDNNCYYNNSKVPGYYYNNGTFNKCDESCEYCSNNYTCDKCKESYYFKFDSVINETLNDFCYKETPKNYYLNTTSLIELGGINYTIVYKKCYENCETCFGEGNIKDNKCINCKENYTSYPFDNTKCTINITNYDNNKTIIWELDDDNNIHIIENCSYYIVFSGENRGQCVKDCQNYTNPFSKSQTSPLFSYECDNDKYCFEFEICKLFNLDFTNKECKRPVYKCLNISIDEKNITIDDDIYKNDTLDQRVKVIKFFDKGNNTINVNSKNLTNEDNIDNLLEFYNKEFKEETRSYYLNGVFLIASMKYNNSIATLYPLVTEDYTYNNYLKLNNLSSINLTELFKNNYNKRKLSSTLQLVCLIEYFNKNDTPINNINYTIFDYDEINFKVNPKINKDDFSSDSSFYVSYPLYNFNNSKITKNKRYSENLVKSVQNLYSVDPNIKAFESDNFFFKNICYTFKSEVNTDMILSDRVNNYYMNMSLCEEDCELENIFDNDEFHHPRALCKCGISKEFDTNSFKDYDFQLKNKKINKKDVNNLKAISCIKNVFSSKKITKNPIFWIFLIILAIQFFIFLNIICCSTNNVKNLLKIEKNLTIDKKYINEHYNEKEKNIKHNEDNNEKCENSNSKEEDKKSSQKEEKENEIETYKDRTRSIKNLIKNSDDDDNNNIGKKSKSKNQNILIKKKSKNNSSQSENISAPPKKNIVNNNKNLSQNTADYKDESKTNEVSSNVIFSYQNKTQIKGTSEATKSNFVIDDNDREFSSIEDIYDNQNNFFYNNYIPDNEKILKNNYLNYDTAMRILDIIKREFMPYDDQLKLAKSCIFLSKKDYENKQKIEKSRKSMMINLPTNYQNEFFNFDSPLYFSDGDIIKNTDKNFDNATNWKRNFKNKKLPIFEKKEEENKEQNLKFSFKEDEIISGDNKVNLQNKNLNDTKNNENDEYSDIESDKKNKNSKRRKKNLNKKSVKNYLDDSNQNSSQSRYNILKKNDIGKDKDNESIEIKNKINEYSISENTKETEEKANKKKNLCKHYYLYLAKREIIISSIYHKKENVPIPVRVSLFFLVMSFAFTINCFLLTASNIHKRYTYALNKKIKEVNYSFTKEFGRIIISAIIVNVFKIICIKIIYNNIFKISAENKEKMSPYIDRNNYSEKEKLILYLDRKEYLNKYKRNLIIYICVAIILNFVFALISVCYVGIFINTFYGLLIGFIFSIIFSFIICALLCFIIVLAYHLGNYFKSKCFNSFYKIMKKIY